MSEDQTTNVLVCASGRPTGGVSFTGFSCPKGQAAYSVSSDFLFQGSAHGNTFDPSVAGGFFGFGFGIIVFFYLLGLKGSVLIRPFWSGWGR